MTFPLPIAPFEEAIIADDRPAYPWSVWFDLKFLGRFDRPHLEHAFRVAFSRHPLFTANLFCENGRTKWRKGSQDVVVNWISRSEPRSREIPDLDLRQSCPTILNVFEGDDYSEVQFITHHALCDGAGAFQLITDFLVEYARQFSPDDSSLRLAELKPEQLRTRADLGLNWWRWLKMAPKLLVGLFGVRQFLMRKPVSMISHEIFPDESPLMTGAPGTLFHQFSSSESQDLRATAKQRQVSLNDLMIRDVILAIGAFRQDRQAIQVKDWIRIAVPINIRSGKDKLTPATNVVSMVFIDRLPSQLKNSDELLKSVADEMGLIKRNRLAYIWPLCLFAFRLLPGGIPRAARNNACVATALFSNVMTLFANVDLPLENGRIRAGNVVLESCDGFGPIRPGMCISLVSMTYAGQLRLSMHYDTRVMTPDDARELMDRVAQNFRDSLQSGCKSSHPSDKLCKT